MSVFAIADLHLSESTAHPMDVFGDRWLNYTEKLLQRWPSVVSDADTVILPGDISWAMNLAEVRADFALLDALPGRKLLGKGNHDFWWNTAAKLGRFFEENGFTTLSLLYNNACAVEDFIVCGARGWFLEENRQRTVGHVDYGKMVRREAGRLRLSLEAAERLRRAGDPAREILVFLHFPPLWGEFRCPEILSLLHEFGVRRCYFGHIHGAPHEPPVRTVDDLSLTLIAADCLDFTPLRIPPEQDFTVRSL